MDTTALLPLAAAAGAVFALAGFVKGVIGMGLPTIAMGLLSVTMVPAQAAALLVVPSLVTNVWQLAGPGLGALLRRLATLLAGVCIGIAAGAGWLTGPAARQPALQGLLGVALVAYAAIGLARVRLAVPARHEPWLSPLAGLLTGLVTAATGVFVIPAVPYLQALGLGKDDPVRALGVSFLVSTIALAASLGHGGALDGASVAASLLALLPALAGMFAGQALRRRIAAEPFRKVFFCGLAVLGLYLAGRAWL